MTILGSANFLLRAIVLHTTMLQTSSVDKPCSKYSAGIIKQELGEYIQIFGSHNIVTDLYVKSCVAECLGLQQFRRCTFNRTTGAVEGDVCTETFYPVTREKMLFCEFHHETFASNRKILERTCDVIVFFRLLRWDRKTKSLFDDEFDLQVALPYIKSAAASKVKRWLRIGAQNNDNIHEMGPKDFSVIAADAFLRQRIINVVVDFLSRYDLDGVYVHWRYPGCPEGKCEAAFQKDRTNSILFYKELASALAPADRVLANFGNAFDTDKHTYLGPDYQQTVTKYVNYTIFDFSGQMGTWKQTLDLTRNIKKMESQFSAVSSSFGPGLKKKAIFMRDMLFHEFVLLDKTKKSIGSPYNNSASGGYLNLKSWCEAFRKSKFTKAGSVNIQKYAFSDTSWIPFEDMEHAQSEVDRMVKKFDMAGVYLEMLNFDDITGQCGVGRMPYVRMYAEALKGGACIFKPFL